MRHTCIDPDHCPRCEAAYEARVEGDRDDSGWQREQDRYERFLERTWEP